MIRHLVTAGYRVCVSVRRPAARDAAATLGAEPVDSPAAAAREASFILTNVTTTSDVEEVLLGVDGAALAAPKGAICIDFSTISALASREIAEQLEARGLHMLDAPVSGGVTGAAAATLSIMVGGRPEIFERAKRLFAVLGKVVTHVGGSGAGQVAKACNQIVQVVNVQGIAEAMLFAGAFGVDRGKVLAAISAGMAGSKMLDLMGPKMAVRNFAAGIEARLHAKDFGLIRKMAEEAGVVLPATACVDEQLKTLLDLGWGSDDTSSLLRVLEERRAKRG
jgi:2-hydroxy-3-oxopropionate reductase